MTSGKPDYTSSIDIVSQTLAEVIIPRLSSLDQSNIPLPYNLNYYPHSDTNVASGSGITFDFTATTWGAGLDFYLYSISLLAFNTNNTAFRKLDAGMQLTVLITPGSSYRIMKTFTGSLVRRAGFSGIFATESFNPAIRFLSTETAAFTFGNDSGATLGNMRITLGGIAK